MGDTFSLLTFNCFGLWLPNTKRRLLALAQELDRRSYQLVCLQEIQLHRYRDLLVNSCAGYSYRLYEDYFHCPKGGLLTLSRMPIRTMSFKPYIERGHWYTPMLMDKLFYKGMLITELTWTSIPIVVINTHLLANFAGDWERYGMYARIEEKQLQQLAKLVRLQSMDSLVIVVGDFNIPRGSKLYNDFLDYSGLRDPLTGDTRPTLRALPGIFTKYALSIDYALVRLPAKRSFKIDCELCSLSAPWRNSQTPDYLSDHDGIELQITVD